MSEADAATVDLTNCDSEPIHRLGYVQPFGALVALTSDGHVVHKSANLGNVLETRRTIAIGDRLIDHLSSSASELLSRCAGALNYEDQVERVFGVRLTHSEQVFDLAMHKSGTYTIIEIEPHDATGVADQTSVLRPMMDNLRRVDEVEPLCRQAAQDLKQLLGFDRVMVYRFHPDDSGEVVAEAREKRLEGFLGLRYPKTDIPAQARELYLRNLFRIIADVNAEPVPIEPRADLSGNALDLSLSTLRSVSPIHIEYLKNMGVGASLSISIVIGGRLWGLFACHHYAARGLPSPVRTMAELFSQLFSMQLEITLTKAGDALKQRGRQLHDRLMSRLASGDALTENLPAIEEAVSSIIPHDATSVLIDGQYRATGPAPTEQEFMKLVPSLNTSATSTIVYSDELKTMIPAAESFADRVVGALVIPISRRPRDYLVLWRKDLPHTVTWAGNPEKPVATGPNGDRLTPRKSFAAWQQSVTGRSAPWQEEELAVAESLRVTLLEVILRITDETMQQKVRAQERQDLLIAELNHRVRNILTLIRGLIGQSRGETGNVEEFAGIIGGRIRALAMAHDAITQKQWGPASLHELIRGESEAYLSGRRDRIGLEGPDALIAPDAFTVVALVLHEMMTNSAKYGSLCDQNGRLTLSTEVDRFGDLRIVWRERGGPPVKAPKRRGFGSTIIEQSIPHELGGDAEIRYILTGVEADFLIPAKYVTEVPADRKSGTGEVQRDDFRDDLSTRRDDAPVLLVEDNLIIAMDGEDMLRQLGFAKIAVHGSVAAALKAIDTAVPQFALLDYNLGDESSDAIAERLGELDVPYWFVTGYGDAIEKMTGSNARGVLKKPYSREDLNKAIGSL